MRREIEERCVRVGRYIAATDATVREAARHFGMSKSCVHKDLERRLPLVSAALGEQARETLQRHKAERHLRGGEATRLKYQSRKQRLRAE